MNENKWILAATAYGLFFIAVGAYANYTTPYDPLPATYMTLGTLLLWTMTYIPVLVLPLFAQWEVREFGFSINPAWALAVLFVAFFCGSLGQGLTVTWYGAVLEAFARTGEELFFRGFLFALLLKIFGKRRRPWIWAILGSSLAFALVHTQTFQPDYFAGSNAGPVAYAIAQRFLDLFLVSVGLALVRHLTHSILPSSLLHGLLKGGILTVPFVLVIYAVLTYWAHRRNEPVLSGFEQKARAGI